MAKKVMGIYQIRNLVNDKIYVGSSSNMQSRWLTHTRRLKRQVHRNPYLQNAWNKYGESNFVFELLEEVDDADGLLLVEQMYLDGYEPEYNIARYATSPMKGLPVSKETREKLSKAGLGRVVSEATRERISNAKKGAKNPMWKKDFTKKHRENISKANSGEKGYWYGKHHSKKTRRKMSEERSGEKNNNFGKKFSDSHRKKISLGVSGEKHPNSKLTERDVIEIRWLYASKEYTQKELGEMWNVGADSISRVVTYKTWKYVE